GALSRDVAAARDCRPPARTAVEGGDGMSTPVLRVEELHLRRGIREILAGVSFDVRAGEIVAIMGPSGSGKTTILRAVAALEPFERGRISMGDVTMDGGTEVPAHVLRRLHRSVGMVFQFHCLFEHLTAAANICLAPVHV